MLKIILDKFILEEILLTIFIINQDFIKSEIYKVDFSINNNENDLYYIIKTIRIYDKGFLKNYIYTNINMVKQNLYLKLISAISNI